MVVAPALVTAMFWLDVQLPLDGLTETLLGGVPAVPVVAETELEHDSPAVLYEQTL
jgi:hypothetical protein